VGHAHRRDRVAAQGVACRIVGLALAAAERTCRRAFGMLAQVPGQDKVSRPTIRPRV